MAGRVHAVLQPRGAGLRRRRVPITRTAGLLINTLVGWAPAALAGATSRHAPEVGAAVWTTLIANAAVHVAVTARARYTPGIATSVTLLTPFGAPDSQAVAKRHGPGAARRGAALGLAAGLPPFAALLAARSAAASSARGGPRSPG